MSALRSPFFAASIALAVGGGCESRPATQITVGVMSQIQVPKELRSIRITASVAGDLKFCETYPVDDGKTVLPQSLALAPGGDPTRPVTVTVVGFEKTKDDILTAVPDDCRTGPVASGPNDAHILRRSKQAYAAARNLYVPMPLRYSCMGVECGAGETCKGGRCAVPDVDPRTLPDFTDDLLFGNRSTCFDPDRCLGDAAGATVVDASLCLYEVPAGTSVREIGMNVRVVYEGHAIEVLDEDPVEGFFRPDASRPARFQLAPGSCNPPPGGRRIVNVNASRSCAPKNVFQPLCALGPRPLAPAVSALYVLMDRESSMSQYLGPASQPDEALDQVMRVVLGDPVFSTTTRVNLRLVGHPEPPACDSTIYATPDPLLGGFVPAWQAANPIAQYLASTMPVSNVKLAADAALAPPPAAPPPAGAASAIPMVPNQRALLLVTNRDPTDGTISCSGGLTVPVVTMAGASVYVMSLRNGAEAPADTQTRAANVKALEPAATVISAEGPDSQSSKLAVLSGLASLVGDLAACVYEDPGGLDPATADVVLDPPGPAPVTVIPRNPACTPGSPADGWNLSGGVVRVCGASCTAIRNAIGLAAQQTAARNAMAPTQGQQVLVFVRPKKPS